MIRSVAASTSVLCLLLTAPGCSEKPAVTTSTTEAEVAGSVTVKGKVVTSGKVIFDPSNYQRNVPARTAEIQKDGTYKITTLLGQNQIRIESPAVQADRELNDSSLFYDVKASGNQYDIVLPPPDVVSTGRGSGEG